MNQYHAYRLSIKSFVKTQKTSLLCLDIDYNPCHLVISCTILYVTVGSLCICMTNGYQSLGFCRVLSILIKRLLRIHVTQGNAYFVISTVRVTMLRVKSKKRVKNYCYLMTICAVWVCVSGGMIMVVGLF